MSSNEIKSEINKVLNNFSEDALSELLTFLKTLDSKYNSNGSITDLLNKVLEEDKHLLAKLAQ